MRILALVLGMSFLLAACSATVPSQAKYEVECKSHARKATFTGSPDEQAVYLECMKITGRHEMEVRQLP